VGKKNLDDFNIGLVSKKDIFCDAVFNQCATEREEEYKEYKEYKEGGGERSPRFKWCSRTAARITSTTTPRGCYNRQI
jgi:hypothetical protein